MFKCITKHISQINYCYHINNEDNDGECYYNICQQRDTIRSETFLPTLENTQQCKLLFEQLIDTGIISAFQIVKNFTEYQKQQLQTHYLPDVVDTIVEMQQTYSSKNIIKMIDHICDHHHIKLPSTESIWEYFCSNRILEHVTHYVIIDTISLQNLDPSLFQIVINTFTPATISSSSTSNIHLYGGLYELKNTQLLVEYETLAAIISDERYEYLCDQHVFTMNAIASFNVDVNPQISNSFTFEEFRIGDMYISINLIQCMLDDGFITTENHIVYTLARDFSTFNSINFGQYSIYAHKAHMTLSWILAEHICYTTLKTNIQTNINKPYFILDYKSGVYETLIQHMIQLGMILPPTILTTTSVPQNNNLFKNAYTRQQIEELFKNKGLVIDSQLLFKELFQFNYIKFINHINGDDFFKLKLSSKHNFPSNFKHIQLTILKIIQFEKFKHSNRQLILSFISNLQHRHILLPTINDNNTLTSL
jgi:hypothetical protein